MDYSGEPSNLVWFHVMCDT